MPNRRLQPTLGNPRAADARRYALRSPAVIARAPSKVQDGCVVRIN